MNIVLSKHSIASLAQVILSGLATAYLLSARRKSTSTWLLVGFFAAFTLSLACAFQLLSSFTLIRVGQGVLAAVFTVLLIQFAYHYPTVSLADQEGGVFPS